jgi:hypothetical protein
LGYDDKVAEICRLSNGWQVEVYDPPSEDKEEKKEAKDSKDAPCCVPSYKSPWRTLAFSTLDEVLAFLKSQEATLKPRNFDEEYAKSFKATVKSITKQEK